VKPAVLLDTGPMLALIDGRDQHHGWTKTQFAAIEPPLLTCEAVLTEACFLARRELGSIESLVGLFTNGVVRLSFSLEQNWSEVTLLMRRYQDIPMSLADGCLVRMSELIRDCTVLTLDSDFRCYRRHLRRSIPLLIPPAKN
jgi:predicted nucleic acid-binding protein